MLLNRYGQRATIFILDKARAFTRSAGKTLLVVLNYTAHSASYKITGTHSYARGGRHVITVTLIDQVDGSVLAATDTAAESPRLRSGKKSL